VNIEHKSSFKSNPEVLPQIEAYVDEKIADLNLNEDIKNNIELAVAEAAANCILHGNKNDESKTVHIKIIISDGQLILSFKDEGDGFEPDKVPDPTIPENILKGSGRGLHIMRSLVDEMKYNFSNSGTELVITFNIP
jgi:serine/threonine-protein kinase RsbW